MTKEPNQKIQRALISVSNKEGVDSFCSFLVKEFNIEIISTGGTLKALKEAGIEAIEISNFTEFPEIMDGRVKTLHPKVHAGICHGSIGSLEKIGFRPLIINFFILKPSFKDLRTNNGYFLLLSSLQFLAIRLVKVISARV